MKHGARKQPIGKSAALFFIAASLTLLLLGAVHLWAVRGNAILLDLTFTGCF